MRNLHNVVSDVLETLNRQYIQVVIETNVHDEEHHILELRQNQKYMKAEFFINANGGITAAVLERRGFSVRFQDRFMDGVMSEFCEESYG
jgi:L-2-hydroxyglutarate oxidase LhgO